MFISNRAPQRGKINNYFNCIMPRPQQLFAAPVLSTHRGQPNSSLRNSEFVSNMRFQRPLRRLRFCLLFRFLCGDTSRIPYPTSTECADDAIIILGILTAHSRPTNSSTFFRHRRTAHAGNELHQMRGTRKIRIYGGSLSSKTEQFNSSMI